MNKKKLYSIFKWLLALCASGFLAYKLANFEHYETLLATWQNVSVVRYVWLWLLLFLLPVNLFFEAQKWRFITRKTEKLSTKTAFRAILAGFSTGFFTPNRLGEVIGRTMFLSPENRKNGIALSVVSGFTQTLCILLFGLPAAYLFFVNMSNKMESNSLLYIAILLFVLVSAAIFYIFLPKFFAKISAKNKISKYTESLSRFSRVELLKILLISAARYAVFSLQFYATLQFFGVNLPAYQAIIGIAANYLFITFTPSFSFSEGAVRSSCAVLVFSVFVPLQSVEILLAGFFIWLINTVLPVMAGSFFIMKKKLQVKK